MGRYMDAKEPVVKLPVVTPADVATAVSQTEGIAVANEFMDRFKDLGLAIHKIVGTHGVVGAALLWKSQMVALEREAATPRVILS